MTNFLAENEAFKTAAKTIHQNTTVKGSGLFSKLDSLLEKELLPEDYKKEKQAAKSDPKQI